MSITDPTGISGLVSWYDASNTGSLTTSGALLTQWNDLSGNGHHIGMTNTSLSPSMSGTLNSVTIVAFGSTKFLTLEPGHGAGYLSPSYTGSTLAWFGVVRRDGTDNAYGRVAAMADTAGNDSNGGSDSYLGIARNGGSGSWPTVLRNGFTLDPGSDLGSGAAWKRIIVTFSGSTATLYVDGSSVASTSDSRSFNFQNYTASALNEGGTFSMAEHGWYSSALTGTNVTDLDAYLNTHWFGAAATKAPPPARRRSQRALMRRPA